jgi:hypothetical protein
MLVFWQPSIKNVSPKTKEIEGGIFGFDDLLKGF